MRKLEILMRMRKNRFNPIKFLSVVKVACVALVVVIFLACDEKDFL
ncbi:hypothetical protein HPHPH18_1574 [Helicobacter pylori Hp H-18]|nr:hypothetical protein HPHPH18_1574 [Helicobacter pylori Hp H-18]